MWCVCVFGRWWWCNGQTQSCEHVVYIYFCFGNCCLVRACWAAFYVEKCYFVFFYQASQFGSIETWIIHFLCCTFLTPVVISAYGCKQSTKKKKNTQLQKQRTRRSRLAKKLLLIIFIFDKFHRHFAMRWSYAQKPLFSILKKVSPLITSGECSRGRQLQSLFFMCTIN